MLVGRFFGGKLPGGGEFTRGRRLVPERRAGKKMCGKEIPWGRHSRSVHPTIKIALAAT